MRGRHGDGREPGDPARLEDRSEDLVLEAEGVDDVLVHLERRVEQFTHFVS